ncbi:MAG: dTMP kinase [Gemmatimonadales bacterium]
MAGTFIVIEGADGIGKTTLANRLADRLRGAGRDVVEVREPGGTPAAEAARKTVLDPALDTSPLAEVFLYLAARADLVSRVIRPALDAGKVVLGDRYELSTEAYQVAGRQLPRDAVLAANRLATGGLVPDITIVLDAPLEVALRRRIAAGTKPDRIESADAEIHRRVDRAFREAVGPGIVHLDASGSADEVETSAWSVVRSYLNGS